MMTTKFIVARRISLPRLTCLVAGLQLAISIAILAAWIGSGDAKLADFFFGYSGPISFLAITGLGFGLSVTAWRQFSLGDPLRRAWLLIVLAAGCHLTGGVLSHLLGAESYVNPLLFFADRWDQTAASSLLRLGRIVGGPLQMAFLAAGLLVVLRAYRGLRLLPKLRMGDYALLAVVVVYTVFSSCEAVRAQLQSSDAISAYSAINLLNDPLLCVLLLEAIFIRRSVLGMGWGLVAKCWGAFTAAIFLTSVGDIGLWAISQEYLPWPYSSLTWFVWFLSFTAYALGPAYQLEASRRAIRVVGQVGASDAWRQPRRA